MYYRTHYSTLNYKSWLGPAVFIMFSLLSNGCKTNAEIRQEFQAREMQEKPLSNPFVVGSSNPVLGTIIWVDPNNRYAVVQLKSNVIETTRPLVSRNGANQPTALLQPSKQRRNSTLGVTIAYGKPNQGDEVILREATVLPESWGYTPTPDARPNSSSFPFVLPKDKQAFTGSTQIIRKPNTQESQNINPAETAP